MNLAELRQKMAAKHAEAKTFLTSVKDGNLSAEQQTQYDAIWGEYQGLKAQVARMEAMEAEEAHLAQIPPGQKAEKANPTVEVGADRAAERPFKSLGEQLITVAQSTKNPYDTDVRLKRLNELAAKEAKATGMSSTVPADGGFALQQDFVAEIQKRTHKTGILGATARRIQIGANSNGIKFNAIDESSRVAGSRWGGIQGYWVHEAAAPTKSKPKLKRVSIDLEKLAGLVYATEELLQDGAALESVIMEGIPEEFGFLMDDAMVNGTGVGQPKGILNSEALVSVTKETGQAASTIVYENVLKMWSRCWARARRRAVWYINQDIEPQLYTMNLAVGTGGAPVFVPPGGASAAPFGTLFGRPIEPIEQCATLGTVGDIILADFSEYVIIEKDGLQSASSIHVKFEEGETAFRFILRTNGQPTWEKALTPYKGSNTLSPYVALATRS